MAISKKQKKKLAVALKTLTQGLELLFKYSPSQPRDDHGRFSRVGGRGSVSGGFTGKPANPKGKSTYDRFMNADGTFTKERQAMHDKIVEEALSKATPVKSPTFYMMGGGPASGKSVALNSGKVKIDKNSLAIDSDEIKKSIPEYRAMTKKKNPEAAAFAHEESSHIASRILKEGAARKLNLVLDGTGDSGIESVVKKVAEAKKNGHKVSAVYVTVDTEVAVQRNNDRAAKTGRLVPEAFVRGAHKAVSTIVPEAVSRGLFDDIVVYDTNVSGQLRTVMSAKGKNMKVHDTALWNDFLAKGK